MARHVLSESYSSQFDTRPCSLTTSAGTMKRRWLRVSVIHAYGKTTASGMSTPTTSKSYWRIEQDNARRQFLVDTQDATRFD